MNYQENQKNAWTVREQILKQKPKIQLLAVIQKNILSLKPYLIFLDVTLLLSVTIIPISLEPRATVDAYSAYENWLWNQQS